MSDLKGLVRDRLGWKLEVEGWALTGVEDGKETSMATGLLQKAADFKGSLQDLSTVLTEDDVEECTRLEVEYFILRTALVSPFPSAADEVFGSAILTERHRRGLRTESMSPNICSRKPSDFSSFSPLNLRSAWPKCFTKSERR